MKKILIVGAGNIGYWYFIALQKIKKIKIKIYILEVSEKNLTKFKKKINCDKKIFFLKNVRNLPKKIDLAIISTTSKHRLLTVKKIINATMVKNFILEKIIEQSLKNLNNFLKLSKKFNFFISFPQRCSKFYQYLSKTKKIKNLKIEVLSTSDDIMSNSIHFLDLFSWISGLELKKIDTTKLYNWHESKRKFFFEAYGTINFFFKKNFCLKIKSNPKQKKGYKKITINKKKFNIFNFYEKIKIKKKVITSNSLAISNVMNIEIEKILNKRTSYLPKFQTIFNNHYKYIENLLEHFNKEKKTNIKNLPIT